jgi:5-methyltetrahydrofolate--homocysteine methyltransferase
MSRFLEALHSGRVLLMDGAMGTELQRAGIGEGECYELWNLTHPERVQAVHRAYAEAGAEVLLTNTFQANSLALQRFGAEKQLKQILRAATDLAYKLRYGQFVIRDIGPVYSPDDGAEFGDPRAVNELVTINPLVDAILLETCSTPRARWAVERLTLLPQRWPVLFSLAFTRHPERGIVTQSSHSPEWFASRAASWGIAALGVNCGRDIGMDEIIEIVRRYRSVTDLPLFARPNAGTPTRQGDHWVYPLTPEAMAAHLPELLEAGVSMVGGCCGTTPAHIAACKPIIDAWNARHPREDRMV